MPVFEYICNNCSNEFETIVWGKEEIICPKCGKNEVEKLFSSFSSVIAGGGKSSGSSSSCGSCKASPSKCKHCH